MQWDRERFKKMFPNLYREMQGGGIKIGIASRRSHDDPWKGYEPSPEDFIARASSVEEAEEVIRYLERTGRISGEKVEELRRKLQREGLEGFGERRSPGYYFRKAASMNREEEISEGGEK